jgi:hypothetical protein
MRKNFPRTIRVSLLVVGLLLLVSLIEYLVSSALS